MIFRGYRYKLAPTAEQEAKFRQFSGVCRLVYNLAFEQRRDFWRQYRATEGRNISKLRAEFEWIAAVPCVTQEQALRDLDMAYGNFFKGRASYPSPRRKGVNDSFRFKGREVRINRLNAKWSMVTIPKLGPVKFRNTRPIDGTIKTATVSLDALGWHISLGCEIEHQAPANSLPIVGIDRGVANTLTLSTGEHLSVPDSLNAIERRHGRAQQILARRKKGSKRRLRQLRRCAKLSAKRARIRRDWHHKAALGIAEQFGTVVLENLKVVNMTASGVGKRGLNRSILNQGWSAFETILAYKLEERGGTLVKVPAAYTSQTCSECGTIDKRSRESQASFNCLHCGFTAHADVNAAINIRRGNTPLLRVEAGAVPAVETRTGLSREVHENHLALAG